MVEERRLIGTEAKSIAEEVTNVSRRGKSMQVHAILG